MQPIKIAPQAGPQTDFISTSADIAIYGGAAGGGKTFALLLEPTRHYNNPQFGGVVFRKTTVQVRNQGGLWDESVNLYSHLRAVPYESSLEWLFQSGMRMKFAGLEYDKDVLNWQGSQIPYIGFDELTHFSEKQFFYMLSRNRSTSGVPAYIRATCNPDPDSWVRKFIDWWIDKEGFPIKSRSGSIRWFIRVNDEIMWFDTKQEVYDWFGDGPEIQPKSVTFIAASIFDNKIFLEKDPSYLANLHALNRVDRMRLKDGNWNVRGTAGMYFKRTDFEVISAVPAGWISVARYWDRASTKPSHENPDPDWTRGVKLYKYPNGVWVVADLKSLRDNPLAVERLVKNTATQDGLGVVVWGEQDPGSAGVADANAFTRLLNGFVVKIARPTRDKVTRAKPISAQCEAGNVKVVRGEWNEEFFTELENFNDELIGHDDIVDALSGAYNEQCAGNSILDVL